MIGFDATFAVGQGMAVREKVHSFCVSYLIFFYNRIPNLSLDALVTGQSDSFPRLMLKTFEEYVALTEENKTIEEIQMNEYNNSSMIKYYLGAIYYYEPNFDFSSTNAIDIYNLGKVYILEMFREIIYSFAKRAQQYFDSYKILDLQEEITKDKFWKYTAFVMLVTEYNAQYVSTIQQATVIPSKINLKYLDNAVSYIKGEPYDFKETLFVKTPVFPFTISTGKGAGATIPSIAGNAIRTHTSNPNISVKFSDLQTSKYTKQQVFESAVFYIKKSYENIFNRVIDAEDDISTINDNTLDPDENKQKIIKEGSTSSAVESAAAALAIGTVPGAASAAATAPATAVGAATAATSTVVMAAVADTIADIFIYNPDPQRTSKTVISIIDRFLYALNPENKIEKDKIIETYDYLVEKLSYIIQEYNNQVEGIIDVLDSNDYIDKLDENDKPLFPYDIFKTGYIYPSTNPSAFFQETTLQNAGSQLQEVEVISFIPDTSRFVVDGDLEISKLLEYYIKLSKYYMSVYTNETTEGPNWDDRPNVIEPFIKFTNNGVSPQYVDTEDSFVPEIVFDRNLFITYFYNYKVDQKDSLKFIPSFDAAKPSAKELASGQIDWNKVAGEAGYAVGYLAAGSGLGFAAAASAGIASLVGVGAAGAGFLLGTVVASTLGLGAVVAVGFALYAIYDEISTKNKKAEEVKKFYSDLNKKDRDTLPASMFFEFSFQPNYQRIEEKFKDKIVSGKPVWKEEYKNRFEVLRQRFALNLSKTETYSFISKLVGTEVIEEMTVAEFSDLFDLHVCPMVKLTKKYIKSDAEGEEFYRTVSSLPEKTILDKTAKSPVSLRSWLSEKQVKLGNLNFRFMIFNNWLMNELNNYYDFDALKYGPPNIIPNLECIESIGLGSLSEYGILIPGFNPRITFSDKNNVLKFLEKIENTPIKDKLESLNFFPYDVASVFEDLVVTKVSSLPENLMLSNTPMFVQAHDILGKNIIDNLIITVETMKKEQE